ncbi:hypothetical protein H2248_003033 [Termitomyces sp. 'cryptogamus']|nr:hypothetical protein H2248_003033 [Termitomyces sp. 'cryptogamus']
MGLFFSAFMLCLTAIQSRYTPYKPSNSEEFSSASRSVKLGLIACGIVSSWTTAATLLQSSAVAYKYGISGPWWYGAGATIQVLLFSQLAAKLKLNAPNAHTWLEIVGERWGTPAHGIFMFFGLATNIINSSLIILGGSATVTDLTGMSTIAAIFLIPLGVTIYVVFGGMRATLLCDYAHTTVLLCIVIIVVFTIYSKSPKIGSISAMHKLLSAASKLAPVQGNAGGSYLTMRSKNGLIFGVINIIGNFATVFNDQAYWQRAIASRPASCVKGYLLGGLAWFAIPFAFSTTVGLAAVALKGDPDMRILTPADVSAGLPAPAAITAVLGRGGAAAMLVLLFLAITSATSAELIAVSSILTYDVYKRYINPRATEAQILKVSHYMVVTYAFMMSIAGLIFFYIGVSMGWLYTFMGVVLGSAVVPTALCVSWSKANKWGCISGAILGFFTGIMGWLVTTASLNGGVVNVMTGGGDIEMLVGNIISLSVGGVIAVVWSYMYPADFDFTITRAINAPHYHTSNMKETKEDDDRKVPSTQAQSVGNVVGLTQDCDLDFVKLNKAFKFAAWSSITLGIILIVVIPLPLFFMQILYGVRGFQAWVVIGIIWVFTSCMAVILLPLWESREALKMVSCGVIKDIFGRGAGKYMINSEAVI